MVSLALGTPPVLGRGTRDSRRWFPRTSRLVQATAVLLVASAATLLPGPSSSAWLCSFSGPPLKTPTSPSPSTLSGPTRSRRGQRQRSRSRSQSRSRSGRGGAAVYSRALPEAWLFASTAPTPAAVSTAFNVITFLPQYIWILMVFLPNWSVTKKIMEPLWPVLLFCAVHLFIVANVAAVNDDNLGDFTELAKVFDPSVSLNLLTDYSPQNSMMKLMSSPGFVSEEWSHVLAWDLFVGRWIYLDGQKRGIFTSHSVLLCNLIGPPGLLAHAVTCLLFGAGLPAESLEQEG